MRPLFRSKFQRGPQEDFVGSCTWGWVKPSCGLPSRMLVPMKQIRRPFFRAEGEFFRESAALTFLKPRFSRRQHVAFAGHPGIYGWQYEDTHDQSCAQSADNDDGERTL